MARQARPDVLLLDLMLPGKNGFEVCRALRPSGQTSGSSCSRSADRRRTASPASKPGAMTTSRSRSRCASWWAVKVGLRRANGRSSNRRETFGAIEVDLAARTVFRAGSPVDLTPKEFEILALLLRRSGEAITRDEFLDEVWGKDVHVTHRTVDTHCPRFGESSKTTPTNRCTSLASVAWGTASSQPPRNLDVTFMLLTGLFFRILSGRANGGQREPDMTLGTTRWWIVVGMLALVAGASWTVSIPTPGPTGPVRARALLEENSKTLGEAITLYSG